MTRTATSSKSKIILSEEQERWLIKHFKHTKNEVITAKFGISQGSLHRIARSLNLKKSRQFITLCQKNAIEKMLHSPNRKIPPKGFIIPNRHPGFQKGITFKDKYGEKAEKERIRKLSATRQELIKRERMRINWGLEQRTKMRLVRNRPKALHRYAMKRVGYIFIGRGSDIAYYDDHTKRKEKLEKKAEMFHIEIKPL